MIIKFCFVDIDNYSLNKEIINSFSPGFCLFSPYVKIILKFDIIYNGVKMHLLNIYVIRNQIYFNLKILNTFAVFQYCNCIILYYFINDFFKYTEKYCFTKDKYTDFNVISLLFIIGKR